MPLNKETKPSREDKGFYTLPKDTHAKVNLIACLEFELAYFAVPVQHFKNYTRGILTQWFM